MPDLKLSYFDFDGGRGEPIRIALFMAGIPFEDIRIPLSQWPETRKNMPLHQTPVMEIDGQVITQSNTLNRYAGKLAGLYPGDPLQAAWCDEAMDVIEDIITRIATTFGMEGDELREAREALAAGPIPLFLSRLQHMLDERGGRYFADDRLTMADLKVFLWIRNLRAGVLDHVPPDLVERHAPALVGHFERVNGDSGVARYYASRRGD